MPDRKVFSKLCAAVMFLSGGPLETNRNEDSSSSPDVSRQTRTLMLIRIRVRIRTRTRITQQQEYLLKQTNCNNARNRNNNNQQNKKSNQKNTEQKKNYNSKNKNQKKRTRGNCGYAAACQQTVRMKFRPWLRTKRRVPVIIPVSGSATGAEWPASSWRSRVLHEGTCNLS